MQKKIKVLVVSIALIVILIFSGYYFRVDRFGNSQVSWVDCIKVDNKMYFAPFNRSLVDGALIQDKIGQVKFNVSEKVRNDKYFFRNYDATYLKVETEIYTYKTDLDAVAVKVGNNFFEYVANLYE